MKKEQQINELTSASKIENDTNVKVKQALENKDKVNEAIAALQVLGYNKKEIEKVFAKLETSEMKTEEIIRKGLTLLANKIN
jgi:Holliday junction resolvasome RuvABC DNA-binding subunit